MDDNRKVKMQAKCGRCHQLFANEICFFYDDKTDIKKETFGMLLCPKCGFNAPSKVPIFYFDKPRGVIYLIFETEVFNSFENTKKLSDSLLDKYLKEISFREQRELQNAKIQYIERELFLSRLFDEPSGNFVLGMRSFRITPPPNITIDKEYCFVGNEIHQKLSKNDISFSSEGLSDLQKSIVTEAVDRLYGEGYVVNLIDREEERKPAVTCGLLQIVLGVGSLIIIPILVNVISDIITEYRQKKNEKNESVLTKRDEISVTIQVDESKRVIHFEGSVDAVAKAMKKCGLESLHTISIKDTHTAIAIDNVVADLMLPYPDGAQTFDGIAREYQKVFSSDAAVELGAVHPTQEETTICQKAAILMEAGDYFGAYWIMMPSLENATTIEFFYNFSLCLSHLDADKEAIDHFSKIVIKKYLCCPDLKDLELIIGNVDQEQFDKVTDNLVDSGLLKRDEDNIAVPIPPKNEKEIKELIDSRRVFSDFLHSMNDYKIEDLRKEAAFNFYQAEIENQPNDR